MCPETDPAGTAGVVTGEAAGFAGMRADVFFACAGPALHIAAVRMMPIRNFLINRKGPAWGPKGPPAIALASSGRTYSYTRPRPWRFYRALIVRPRPFSISLDARDRHLRAARGQ